jgi:hypothetical protein
MTRFKTLTTMLFAAVMLGAGATAASAETRFEQNHPRRAEVVERAHHQIHRIRHERREGEISARRAHRLIHADHRIIREQHRMARQHGGHITRSEAHALNQQENRVGGAIAH